MPSSFQCRLLLLNTVCIYAYNSLIVFLEKLSPAVLQGIKMEKKHATDVRALLGARILEKRKDKQLTQAELADFLNIEQHSLSRIEKGQMAPKLSRLQDIANGLDCTIADLFRTASQLPNTTNIVKANEIVELLSELPPAQQRIVLELVEKTVGVLKKANK